MKKGLDTYYKRCVKKGVKIAIELKKTECGNMAFSIRDPFGTTLTFAEPCAKDMPHPLNILGVPIDKNSLKSKNSDYIKTTLDQIINGLKDFGISRRAAKKFAKSKLKELSKIAQ
jgi:hypothetical protein